MIVGSDLSAFDRSRIPGDTIQAYLDTQYQVQEPTSLVLRIGRRHHGLAALLIGHGAMSAAVVTAWNPYSKRKSRRENERQQSKLVASLEQRRLPHYPAAGVDPIGLWPAEESRLVLGIDFQVACDLAGRFGQNGIVWANRDGLSLLVLLR